MPSHSSSGGGGSYGWLPDRRMEERNKERERREREAAEYKRRHHIVSGDHRRDYRDIRERDTTTDGRDRNSGTVVKDKEGVKDREGTSYRDNGRSRDGVKDQERDRDLDREIHNRDNRDSPPIRSKSSGSPQSGYPESSSSLSTAATNQRPPMGPSRQSASSILSTNTRNRSPSPDHSYHTIAPKRYSTSNNSNNGPPLSRWQVNRPFPRHDDNESTEPNDQRRRVSDEYRRLSNPQLRRVGSSGSNLPSGPSYWERERTRWDWESRDNWEGGRDRDIRDRDRLKWERRQSKPYARENDRGDRKPSHPRDYYERHPSYTREEYFDRRPSSSSTRRSREPSDDKAQPSNSHSFRGRMSYDSVDETNGSIKVGSFEWKKHKSSASDDIKRVIDKKEELKEKIQMQKEEIEKEEYKMRVAKSKERSGQDEEGDIKMEDKDDSIVADSESILQEKIIQEEGNDVIRKDEQLLEKLNQPINDKLMEPSPAMSSEQPNSKEAIEKDISVEPVIESTLSPKEPEAELVVNSASTEEVKPIVEKLVVDSSIEPIAEVKVTEVGTEVATEAEAEGKDEQARDSEGREVDTMVEPSEEVTKVNIEGERESIGENSVEVAVKEVGEREGEGEVVKEVVEPIVETIIEAATDATIELKTDLVEPINAPTTELPTEVTIESTASANEQPISEADTIPQTNNESQLLRNTIEPTNEVEKIESISSNAPPEPISKALPEQIVETEVEPSPKEISRDLTSETLLAAEPQTELSLQSSQQPLPQSNLQIIQPISKQVVSEREVEAVDILNQFAILATEKTLSLPLPEPKVITDSDTTISQHEVKTEAIVKETTKSEQAVGAPFPLNKTEQLFFELENIPKDTLRKGMKYLQLENPFKHLVDYEVFLRNNNHYEEIHDSLLNAIDEYQNQLSIKREISLRDYLALKKTWKKFCEEAEEDFHNRYERKNVEVEVTNGIVPDETISNTTTNTTTTAPVNPVDERASRRGRAVYQADSVRSEAEFLEILANLERENARDPLVRAQLTAAAVPDMIFDPIEREKFKFMNSNNFVGDKSHPYKRLVTDAIDDFTAEEHEAFCEAYSLHPKEFGKIARMMGGRRTFGDCVAHYYQTKKKVDYKGLVMSRFKRGTRKSKRKAKTGVSSAVTPSGNGSRTAAVSETEDTNVTTTGMPVTPTIPDTPIMESPFEALATVAVNQAKEESGEKRKFDDEVGDAKKRVKTTRTPRGTGKRAQQKREEAAAATAAALEEKILQQKQDQMKPEEMNGSSSTKDKVSSYWSLVEIGTFEKLLETFGTRWEEMAKFMKNKSIVMLKNYYHKYAAERRYDDIVARADEENSTREVQPKFEGEVVLSRPRYREEQVHEDEVGNTNAQGHTQAHQHSHSHAHSSHVHSHNHSHSHSHSHPHPPPASQPLSQSSAQSDNHHHYHQLAPNPAPAPVQQQPQPQPQPPQQQQEVHRLQISPPPQMRNSPHGPSPGFFAPRAKSITTIVGPSGHATVAVGPIPSKSPPVTFSQSTPPPNLPHLMKREILPPNQQQSQLQTQAQVQVQPKVQPQPQSQQSQPPRSQAQSLAQSQPPSQPQAPRPILPPISNFNSFANQRPILKPSRTSTIASILNGDPQGPTFERGPSPQLPPLASTERWYESRFSPSPQQTEAQIHARQQQVEHRTQLPKPVTPSVTSTGPPAGQFSVPANRPIANSPPNSYVSLPPLPVRSAFPTSNYSTPSPSSYSSLQHPQYSQVPQHPQQPQQQAQQPQHPHHINQITDKPQLSNLQQSPMFGHNYEQPTSRESNERGGFYHRNS